MHRRKYPIKNISKEEQNEIEILKDKINALDAPKKVKDKLLVELNKYSMSNYSSPETGMIRTYIDWLLNLPWNNYTEDRKDLKKVEADTDRDYWLDADEALEYGLISKIISNRNKQKKIK